MEIDAARILYHGTSLDRAGSIMRDGVIRRARHGVQCVSLTDDPKVAHYFAALAADADRSTPVIIPVDGARLKRDGFELESHSDPVWGEGVCDWECETACWQDIPLDYTRGLPKRGKPIPPDTIQG